MAEHDDEPTMSHLLAHGQNRNQYTGSEPTSSTAGLTFDKDGILVAMDGQGPTTPKPHVHERFKLIYNEDMREIALRVCEDCGYADTEDYWRGWEARGLVRRGHD